MRTIFHVGQAKTGTTALQSTFAASRDALRRKGVLYPPAFKKDNINHKMLFAHLFEPRDVPRHVLADFPQEALAEIAETYAKRLKAKIERQRPDLLLLSSESRFTNKLDREKRGAFQALLAEMGVSDPEIAIYIRRPSSHFLSLLQQNLRHSHEVRKLRSIRVAAIVAGFEEDFGLERTHVRAFDRKALIGGDVVRDFVETYLAPHGVAYEDLTAGVEDNVSLSAEGTDIVRRFRLAFYRKNNNRITRKGNLFLKALDEAERTVRPPRITMFPHLVELLDYAGDDLLVLRDRHGLVMPNYDYERLERAELTAPNGERLPLNRIVAIDAEVQLKLVERLTRSRWAEAMPNHAQWLAALPAEIERDAESERRRERQDA